MIVSSTFCVSISGHCQGRGGVLLTSSPAPKGFGIRVWGLLFRDSGRTRQLAALLGLGVGSSSL